MNQNVFQSGWWEQTLFLTHGNTTITSNPFRRFFSWPSVVPLFYIYTLLSTQLNRGGGPPKLPLQSPISSPVFCSVKSSHFCLPSHFFRSVYWAQAGFPLPVCTMHGLETEEAVGSGIIGLTAFTSPKIVFYHLMSSVLIITVLYIFLVFGFRQEGKSGPCYSILAGNPSCIDVWIWNQTRIT